MNRPMWNIFVNRPTCFNISVFSLVSAFSQKNKTYKIGLCVCVFLCVCVCVCVCLTVSDHRA